MNKSYSAHITDAKVMIDALRNNHGKVTKIDNPFIMEMERLREEVEKLNSEQERLKADLKSKTEELTNRIKELDEKYTFAKKRVKVDIPPAGRNLALMPADNETETMAAIVSVFITNHHSKI